MGQTGDWASYTRRGNKLSFFRVGTARPPLSKTNGGRAVNTCQFKLS